MLLPRVSIPPAKAATGPREGEGAAGTDDANHKLRAVLQEVLQLDATGVLENAKFKDPAAETQQSLEDAADEFRQLVSAEILKHWPRNKAQAQQASDLLDRGNALLIAFERSGGSATTSAAAERHEASDDSFWELPPEQWKRLLVLEAHRGDGPATLHEEPQGGLRRRRLDGGRGRTYEHEWTGLARARIKPSSLLPQNVQHQLALLLEQVIESSKTGQQVDNEGYGEEKGTPAMVIIQRCIQKLHSGVEGEALLTLPLDFSDICRRLRKGVLPSLMEVTQLVAEACQEAGVEAGYAAADAKQTLLQQADSLSAELAIALRDIVATFRKEGVVLPRSYYIPIDLPESIRANSEAYFQGDWRKAPYAPRPYQRLQTYSVEEDKKVLTWKLSTSKRTQCSGQHCTVPGKLGSFSLEKESFRTECLCLAKNSECGAKCGCSGGRNCLNSAIQRRAALKTGVDVSETDTWGMDCYTRRNIQDAVLEDEAFGPYTRPDYKALLRKKNASVMNQGETLQHSLKGSEAGIEQPKPGKVTQASQAAQLDATGPQSTVIAAVAHWHETVLMPAINQQGSRAWDLKGALDLIQHRDAGTPSGRAAAAVAARLKKVGANYFRVHPKGVGIVCRRPEGLPPLTFVEEYFGEVHTPSRWFEIQDALKKSNKDELPDFYNIQLERPKDDPGGYDCLFIDAASKGAFVSRMSHSCTPNCQAVVMTTAGRLTIAVYTLRQIQDGEELTFDYSSVTESEKEFRAAVCLCGTTACRGSFLYFAGSKAFMQVLSSLHGMFARQVMILRAGVEAVTEKDRARLEKFGVRSCALGWGPGKQRVPEWLQKWVCLVLEYVETEQKLLAPQLLAIPPPLGNFTPETAASQAKGVSDNRLQNVVITLDKVKLCLTKPGQPQGPPLLQLSDEETAEYIWTGERSVAKRVLRAAAATLANAAIGKTFASAQSLQELQQAVDGCGAFRKLHQLGTLVMRPAKNADEARKALFELSDRMSILDSESSLPHSAAGDLLLMYASTRIWFRARRDYRGFASPPVRLNMKDLALNRLGDGLQRQGSSNSLANGNGIHEDSIDTLANGVSSKADSAQEVAKRPRSKAGDPVSRLGKKAKLHDAAEASDPLFIETDEAEEADEAFEEDGGQETKAKQRRGGLSKKYGPWFVWGQLNGWYKQTVYDPTASLSAERRGTITLPDIECIYSAPRSRYTSREKEALIDQIEKRPDAPWRSNTMWTFRNDAKVFGSPMFDSAWSRVNGTQDPMPELLARLKGGKG